MYRGTFTRVIGHVTGVCVAYFTQWTQKDWTNAMSPLHQRRTISPHWGTECPNACLIATSSLKHKACLAHLLTLFCPHCCLCGTPHNVSHFRTGHWTSKPNGSYSCCLATSLGSPTVSDMPRGAWALVPCSPCPMWKQLSKCWWRGWGKGDVWNIPVVLFFALMHYSKPFCSIQIASILVLRIPKRKSTLQISRWYT